jgi:hypothetical protein
LVDADYDALRIVNLVVQRVQRLTIAPPRLSSAPPATIARSSGNPSRPGLAGRGTTEAWVSNGGQQPADPKCVDPPVRGADQDQVHVPLAGLPVRVLEQADPPEGTAGWAR